MLRFPFSWQVQHTGPIKAHLKSQMFIIIHNLIGDAFASFTRQVYLGWQDSIWQVLFTNRIIMRHFLGEVLWWNASFLESVWFIMLCSRRDTNSHSTSFYCNWVLANHPGGRGSAPAWSAKRLKNRLQFYPLSPNGLCVSDVSQIFVNEYNEYHI